MRSWKTTVSALATAGFGFVLFSPQYFPVWAVDLAKYAMLGGLAAPGIAAKDASVHSNAVEVIQASDKAEEKAIAAANGR